MDAASIVVEGLSKRFASIRGEGIDALRDVSFEVREGEFVSIVGLSGCGKSTLLRCMAGLVAPTAGRILFHGKPAAGPRDDIGIVFQESVLLPWRTVLQNAMLRGTAATASIVYWGLPPGPLCQRPRRTPRDRTHQTSRRLTVSALAGRGTEAPPPAPLATVYVRKLLAFSKRHPQLPDGNSDHADDQR